jgi:hypothetical protein
LAINFSLRQNLAFLVRKGTRRKENKEEKQKYIFKDVLGQYQDDFL